MNMTKAGLHRKKTVSGNIIGLVLVTILALLFLFPFYWMLVNSFKPMVIAEVELFPSKLTMLNWKRLFNQPALRWLLNSIIMAAGTMLMVLITASMAGYSLAKKKYPGRQAIFWMFVAVMTLPRQVLMVPLFTMIASWGWLDTFTGIIIPAVGWPFGVFLMKQFTQTLPTELLEAARMDGCSEYRTFTSIVLPMVKPGLGALAIFTFMTSWNDYFWQLITLSSKLMKTLPLGVAGLQLEYAVDYGLMMAGGTMSSVPMVVIFLAFQKYFTKGITMGAVKG